jgi:hypothetical protein
MICAGEGVVAGFLACCHGQRVLPCHHQHCLLRKTRSMLLSQCKLERHVYIEAEQ